MQFEKNIYTLMLYEQMFYLNKYYNYKITLEMFQSSSMFERNEINIDKTNCFIGIKQFICIPSK